MRSMAVTVIVRWPGARLQVDAGAGDVRAEPLAVRERDHVVLVALPDRRAPG